MQRHEPNDGRGREPGEHPSVRRSGRSRSTAIGFVSVMILAVLMYAAIVTGIFSGG